MIPLPGTLYNYDSEVTIEDKVCFVFEDVMRRLFCKDIFSGNSKGKMLLDFLERKQHENFLS